MAVDKVNVLNDQGVSTMLEEVFQTVENNYIRRTQHASDMAALEGKLTDGSVTKLTKQTIGSEKVGIYLKDGVPTPTEGAGVPDNHADPTTKFGGGTTVNYGHVKLSDAYETSAGSADQSVAASSKAVADALGAAKTYMAGEVDKMFGEALTFEVEDGDLYVSYNVTSTAQFSINSDGNLVMTY